MAGIDTAAVAGQVKQINTTLADLAKLLEAKGVDTPAAAPAAPAAAGTDQNITLAPGQGANVALEQPKEAPAAGGPAAAAEGDQSAFLKELLAGLTQVLGKLTALVQQLMAQGLGALTGGDQKADLTKPQGGGPAGQVQATGEPKWNGDGTYTVPTANGPVTVPQGTPISGYTFGPDNHYKDNATGKTVNDPLKITLDGTDAQLNTTDKAKIRMEDGTVKTMSGGLNDNEAWLAKDRDGLGVTKNGVIDGEDVFGDHMGQFQNAYDQLGKEYADEIKTDEKGNKYLDLTDPNSRAARELKLVDKSGRSIGAASKLKRIDVSYADVNQVSGDGLTSIRQQGNVQYTDGRTAKAVDQWFTAS